MKVAKFQVAKSKRYMTPYNNMSCKNNPTSKNEPKVHSLAWAYLRCKDKHFFTLHKTFQEFYFNFFHPPQTHTLSMYPNQQQTSSNLQARKQSFRIPTHNVYSPGIAKRSSLSGISAQFNQSTPIQLTNPTQKKSNSHTELLFFYINHNQTVDR